MAKDLKADLDLGDGLTVDVFDTLVEATVELFFNQDDVSLFLSKVQLIRLAEFLLKVARKHPAFN